MSNIINDLCAKIFEKNASEGDEIFRPRRRLRYLPSNFQHAGVRRPERGSGAVFHESWTRDPRGPRRPSLKAAGGAP